MTRSNPITLLALALVLASTSSCGGDDANDTAAQGSASIGAGGAGATGGASSTSGAGAATGASTSRASATGAGGGPMCMWVGSSSLPDVKLEVSPQPCTFTLAEAAAGIEVPYEVTVANDVTGVVPATQDAGGCGQPGPSGLIVFEQLSGNGQNYCICDQGLCAPPSTTPVTLAKGDYAGKFTWHGKNWSGPSDTGNPEGAPFPPGEYELELSATGTWSGPSGDAKFTVLTTWPITLVP